MIQQCGEDHSVGGYATNGLGTIQNYLNNIGLEPDTSTATADLRFITVTVNGTVVPEISPGDTDPIIPLIFAENLINLANSMMGNENLRTARWDRAQAIHDRGRAMIDNGGTWWQAALSPPDDMTYECDTSLGSPTPMDCSQLQWQGFGNPSDSIQIIPGNPKSFFSSKHHQTMNFTQKLFSSFRLIFCKDSCGVVVNAIVPVVLLVRQLADAFAVLLATCVEVPTSSPHGGRAYYGIHPTPSISIPELFGQHNNKRDPSGLSGLNALPPHVNMTMFAHNGPASSITCETQAVQQRRPLSSCDAA